MLAIVRRRCWVRRRPYVNAVAGNRRLRKSPKPISPLPPELMPKRGAAAVDLPSTLPSSRGGRMMGRRLSATGLTSAETIWPDAIWLPLLGSQLPSLSSPRRRHEDARVDAELRRVPPSRRRTKLPHRSDVIIAVLPIGVVDGSSMTSSPCTALNPFKVDSQWPPMPPPCLRGRCAGRWTSLRTMNGKGETLIPPLPFPLSVT
uniref:Uncharacterized protein n=1 Tax=Oryza sativa subsp. japonica TaxID=39947 RepID=Q6K9E7_ORYSJ|nr:hypothetical protein [Oryza sativa Japonica Group]